MKSIMLALSTSTSPSSSTSVGTRISGFSAMTLSPSEKTDQGRCSKGRS
jgi:exo-beta-1,3-glucanase (GH17 family)